MTSICWSSSKARSACSILYMFIHVQDFIGGLLAGAQVNLVMREAIYEELKEDIYGEAVNVL